MNEETKDKIIRWLLTGRVGISGKHMLLVALYGTGNGYIPADASDFSRCMEMVKAIPELREYFDRIAESSYAWNIIIENWDDLCERASRPGSVYDRMKELGI